MLQIDGTSYRRINHARKEDAWGGMGKGQAWLEPETRLAYTGHNSIASASQASRDEPPDAVSALASLMIVRTVAMQRPQFRRQPRHT